MGRDTAIQWAHHTANAWIGCTKVSPACDHCYAERGAKRLGVEWGDGAERRLTDIERLGNNIAAWNRAAERAGARHRVFWNSYSDFLEDREELIFRRASACALMKLNTHLDHLIVTKRPENALRLMPAHWLQPGGWPAHIWFGFTAETQELFDARWEQAQRVPAPIRFVSLEPLLARINLYYAVTYLPSCPNCGDGSQFEGACRSCGDGVFVENEMLNWVIVGGESGPHARPGDLALVRDIVQQCRQSHTACFVKQLGAVPETSDGTILTDVSEGKRHLWNHERQTWDFPLKDKKGGDPNEWPEDLRVREFPTVAA